MFPCPIKYFTGIDCPGCGIQRSIKYLIELKLKDSFEIYPPLIIGIILTFLFLTIKILSKKELNFNILIKCIMIVVTFNYIFKALI